MRIRALMSWLRSFVLLARRGFKSMRARCWCRMKSTGTARSTATGSASQGETGDRTV